MGAAEEPGVCCRRRDGQAGPGPPASISRAMPRPSGSLRASRCSAFCRTSPRATGKAHACASPRKARPKPATNFRTSPNRGGSKGNSPPTSRRAGGSASTPEGRSVKHTYISEDGGQTTEDSKDWVIAQILVDLEDQNDWEARFTVSLADSRAPESGRAAVRGSSCCRCLDSFCPRNTRKFRSSFRVFRVFRGHRLRPVAALTSEIEIYSACFRATGGEELLLTAPRPAA